MSLDLNELRELLAAINETDIAELTLKSADFELTVRRGVRVEERLYTSDVAQIQGAEPLAVMAAPPALGSAPSLEAAGTRSASGSASSTAANSAYANEPLRDSKADRRLVEIISPMVGTFYRAAAPDEPPFVEVGDRIRKGQTVCIIEAMKLMNELEADAGGEVVEILVQNGEPVEYGQLLLRLNPD